MSWAWDAQGADLDPASRVYIRTFLGYGVVNPNLATNRWAVATACALPKDPIYTIPLTKQGGKFTFRCPEGSRPDPAGDGHLTVWNVADGNVEHDLWQAKYDEATGRIVSASAATTFPYGSVNVGHSSWSGNAANTPLRRGLVVPEHFNEGVIRQTLQFGCPKIGGTARTWRYPALHNAPTCGSDCNYHLVEGSWLRFSPELDVEALKISEPQKIIARAIQEHGMILRDNSGSLVIYGENPINRPVSWPSSGGAMALNLPWEYLELLQPPA